MENNFFALQNSYNRLKKKAEISHGDIRDHKKKYLKKYYLIILKKFLINILVN